MTGSFSSVDMLQQLGQLLKSCQLSLYTILHDLILHVRAIISALEVISSMHHVDQNDALVLNICS